MDTEQKMLSDPNLIAMYDVEMPGMMPPMTSGSAMTNGTGSCGIPLPISKGSISARRIESEEEHSVEKKSHTILTRGFDQWW